MQDLVMRKKFSSEIEPPLLIRDGDDFQDEEIITPYVIVNKTDLAIIVKRLFKKQVQDNSMQQYQDLLKA